MEEYVINKIAVIVLIKNNGKFIEDCVDSIIYQTLNDIEIYFIGNKYETYEIIEKYAANDNRIKFSLDDNFNFDNIESEYVIFINSDDWFDLCTFENLYDYSNNNDLDILMFDKLNFIDNTYFKKNSLNEFIGLKTEFIPEIFDFKDIDDVIFKISPSIYCKLYKTSFLKKLNFEFKNDSYFEYNLLFFKSILTANKISVLEKSFYICRTDNNFPELPLNILSDLVNYLNNLINIFKDFELLENYKLHLFNYKFDAIRYWYSFIKAKFKAYNFEYIRKDFFNMYEDKDLLKYLKVNLTSENLLFFEMFVNSASMNELFLSYENRNFKQINKHLMEQNNMNKLELMNHELFLEKINSWCDSLNDIQYELYSKLESLEEKATKLNAENNTLKREIHENSITIANLQMLNKEINKLTNENNILKKEIQKNTITISNLNDVNYYLNLKIRNLLPTDSNLKK